MVDRRETVPNRIAAAPPQHQPGGDGVKVKPSAVVRRRKED